MGTLYNQLDKEKTLETLRPYFERGMSITKACEASGICDDQTIFNWIKDDELNGGTNPSLSSRIKAWQNTVSTAARNLIAEGITETDPKKAPLAKRERIRLARWWLRHKERKEFSTRQEIENSGSIDLTNKGKQVDDLINDVRNKQKRK